MKNWSADETLPFGQLFRLLFRYFPLVRGTIITLRRSDLEVMRRAIESLHALRTLSQALSAWGNNPNESTPSRGGQASRSYEEGTKAEVEAGAGPESTGAALMRDIAAKGGVGGKSSNVVSESALCEFPPCFSPPALSISCDVLPLLRHFASLSSPLYPSDFVPLGAVSTLIASLKGGKAGEGKGDYFSAFLIYPPDSDKISKVHASFGHL